MENEIMTVAEALERNYNQQLKLLRELMEKAKDKEECLEILDNFIKLRI